MACCSIPFWWDAIIPLPKVSTSFMPLLSMLKIHTMGTQSLIFDVLRFLLPLLPAGAALAFLHERTRLYQAFGLGAVLGLLRLLTVGVFYMDSVVLGLAGCGTGFATASFFITKKPRFTRQCGAILVITTAMILGCLCLFSDFPKLSAELESELPLPETIGFDVELETRSGTADIYAASNAEGVSSTFDGRINEVEVDYGFEDWERLGMLELSSMGSFLPEVYGLYAVKGCYTLHFLPAVEGAPIYGSDILVSFDPYGKPLSIESQVTDFVRRDSIGIISQQEAFYRAQEGEGYMLLILGDTREPSSLIVQDGGLAYVKDEQTELFLPCWGFTGTANFEDGTAADFILYVEAIA
ncbi:MAG: hypothetical protein Q4C01_04050 [Clostridia bacterium]|nr:hypothetical protein [Clostridia bacterium]